MPLGVCAQGHAEHEGAGHSAHMTATDDADAPGGSVEHAHGGHEMAAMTADGTSVDTGLAGPTDVRAGEHAPVPTDCVAMSGCGAPALSVGPGVELQVGELRARRAERLAFGSPLAVDLGLQTPPPRI